MQGVYLRRFYLAYPLKWDQRRPWNAAKCPITHLRPVFSAWPSSAVPVRSELGPWMPATPATPQSVWVGLPTPDAASTASCLVHPQRVIWARHTKPPPPLVSEAYHPTSLPESGAGLRWAAGHSDPPRVNACLVASGEQLTHSRSSRRGQPVKIDGSKN